MVTRNKMYVQYGCGLCAPKEWLNFDSSPTLRLQRIWVLGGLRKTGSRKFPRNVRFGDIVSGLGLPDKSADAIYASHILEHLSLAGCEIALKNTFKLLRPGATFRLVVPDLGWRAKEYVARLEKRDASAAKIFMNQCHLGRETRPKSFRETLSLLFGGSAHLWMWDEFSMRNALADAGFASIRRCSIGDSGDPMFDLVEDHGRFFENGFPELAFEAKRPADFEESLGLDGPSMTPTGPLLRDE